jgi:hypothetical protein
MCLGAFVVTAVAYSAAIGAAVRWSSAVRASIDLHRREVYENLSVRPPTTFADERQSPTGSTRFSSWETAFGRVRGFTGERLRDQYFAITHT